MKKSLILIAVLSFILAVSCSSSSSGSSDSDKDNMLDSDSTINPDNDSAAKCGDGKIDANETCDGGTKKCTEISGVFTGGEASCKDDCSAWSTKNCISPEDDEDIVIPENCGNDKLDSGEVCDGTAIKCSVLDTSYESGDAICKKDCSGYITTECKLKASDDTDEINPDEAPDSDNTADKDTVVSDEDNYIPEVDEDYLVDVDPSLSGCEVPSKFMQEFSAPSFIKFSFAGKVNDPEKNENVEGKGIFQTKLRGENINVGADFAAAYQGSGFSIVLKTIGIVDEAQGIINYAEIKVALDDIMNNTQNCLDYNKIDASKEDDEDCSDPHAVWMSTSSLDTTVKVYSGKLDSEGYISKLCLQATPTGEAKSGGLYLCETDYNYSNFYTTPSFGFSGNLILFDDANALKKANGIQCVCDNGNGGWRNCDDGVPNVYGLLRAKLVATPQGQGNYRGYIFDHKKLWGNGFNKTYALEHPEGVWEDNSYSPHPLNGGLNIGSYSVFNGEGLYRFQVGLPHQDYKSQGFVTHDTASKKLYYTQQSYHKTTNEPWYYWMTMILPDNLTAEQEVTFGDSANDAQIFVYDSETYCIMAIACGDKLRITKAENLAAAEGGKLEFIADPVKWENDPNYPTKYSIRMYHPNDKNIPCDPAEYFAQAGFGFDPNDPKIVCEKY